MLHCTGEECATLLDIDYDNLNEHLIRDGHGGFTEYFKKHSAGGKMSLRRRQWHKAIDDDNTTMQIWLGKQNLGQSDRSKTEITGKDGGPVQQQVSTGPVDMSQYTTEELEFIDQMNKRIAEQKKEQD